MLGNCDKIIISSIPTHQWPQNQQIPDHDHKTFMTTSSSSPSPHKANMADKTNQDPNLQQPLKCPRCDSSNTKFCYYNNYSLSQPRHFCKACKRYWTRGGTLRNVPVGGGCRKNKRFKRPSSSGGNDIPSSAASTAAVNPSVQPRIDLSPAASNHINHPLFYSLHTNVPVELNSFPFSSFRVSNSDHNTGFDLQPQMNNLGIGFSSGLIQEAINTSSSTTSSLGNYNNPVFFGSSTLASTSTMASLLASSFQHQKFCNGGLKDIINQAANNDNVPGLMRYEDGKEVKLEEENRLAWNPNPNPNPNPIEQINSSDPSLWNTSNVGSWFDPSNMGSSSVPSLI